MTMMGSSKNPYGDILRSIRGKSLSQQKLADLSGTNRKTVSKYEHKDSERISLDVLTRIANALKYSPFDIIYISMNGDEINSMGFKYQCLIPQLQHLVDYILKKISVVEKYEEDLHHRSPINNREYWDYLNSKSLDYSRAHMFSKPNKNLIRANSFPNIYEEITDDVLLKQIATNIKQMRMLKGFSQEKLAERVSVAQSCIVNYENAGTFQLDKLQEIAWKLDVPILYFFESWQTNSIGRKLYKTSLFDPLLDHIINRLTNLQDFLIDTIVNDGKYYYYVDIELRGELKRFNQEHKSLFIPDPITISIKEFELKEEISNFQTTESPIRDLTHD